jgi:hypothetical protein
VKNGLSATLDPPGADGADAFAVLSSRGDVIGESGVYLVGRRGQLSSMFGTGFWPEAGLTCSEIELVNPAAERAKQVSIASYG